MFKVVGVAELVGNRNDLSPPNDCVICCRLLDDSYECSVFLTWLAVFCYQPCPSMRAVLLLFGPFALDLTFQDLISEMPVLSQNITSREIFL